MKLCNIKKAWLPDNAHQEEEIANELLEYAKNETSYSLRPFTLAKDIDSHSFDEWIQNDYEGFLPNCAFLADMAIKKRIEGSEQPRKKNTIAKFLLPFITIHKTSDYNVTSNKINERYPNNLSFSVLHNPLYEREKMYNVGAGIKRNNLELHNDDVQLAEYIQIRKSQRMKDKFIIFTDRKELLSLANLNGIKHSGMANKKLIQKLKRYKEKGIITAFPKQVMFPLHIKIR